MRNRLRLTIVGIGALLVLISATFIVLRPDSSSDNGTGVDAVASGTGSDSSATSDTDGAAGDKLGTAESQATNDYGLRGGITGGGNSPGQGGTAGGGTVPSGGTTPNGGTTPGGTTTVPGTPTPGGGKPKLGDIGIGQPLNQSPSARYEAPTNSLNLVANALAVNNKSITGVVRVPSGLVLSAKVEISVVYDGVRRLTQDYNSVGGNKIYFQYDPLDGKPRSQRVQVSLYEVQPTGRIPFQMPFNITITPLYDVTVGPLTFNLVTPCDAVGGSEPVVGWFNPDKTGETKSLYMHSGQSVVITEFAWSRTEISLAQGFIRPFASWEEDDSAVVRMINAVSGFPPGADFVGHGVPNAPLLPGKTHKEQWDMNDPRGSDCAAFLSYQITYTVDSYPQLF